MVEATKQQTAGAKGASGVHNGGASKGSWGVAGYATRRTRRKWMGSFCFFAHSTVSAAVIILAQLALQTTRGRVTFFLNILNSSLFENAASLLLASYSGPPILRKRRRKINSSTRWGTLGGYLAQLFPGGVWRSTRAASIWCCASWTPAPNRQVAW